jgi:hypothetical protein
LITSGEGIKLQYLDSCIIEKLIQFSIKDNIPILTIHDSVICPVEYAVLIKDKMWSYFVELLDRKLNIKIRYHNYSQLAMKAIGTIDRLTPKRYSKPNIQYDYHRYKLNIDKYQPHEQSMKTWLRADDIINIKHDVRANSCSEDCNHHKRVSAYLNNKRCYLSTIRVSLIKEKQS